MTKLLCSPLAVLAAAALGASAQTARAAGRIDPDTVVAVPHGVFNGVPYARYDAMFEGTSSHHRKYRVPCELVAPARPADGSGLVLFEWPNRTAVPIIGQEFPFGRYILTDDFLFGRGASFATVRCDPIAIGAPWSDGSLDTSSESIKSAGDEYDIVVEFVQALGTDPVAVEVLGPIDRTAGIGYSQSGWRLRGLLRRDMGKGLFDFSLVGGCGTGFDYPTANQVKHSTAEKPPLAGTGLEIDFCTEAEVLASNFDAANARHENPNYRNYEFAGGSHLRQADLLAFGGVLPDSDTANPADWFPFARALFVAGNNWCDGVEPPPSIWLGPPRDPTITRDDNGNALVRYVGGEAVETNAYRLPEVAVGENRYIAFDPSYVDGTLIGLLRAIMGGFVDLTDNFADHDDYVEQVTAHARRLQEDGYLLPADTDAIIRRAIDSDIGR